MDGTKRPGSSADALEIQEWMDANYTWAIAKGMRDALDDDDPEVASDEGERS